ncbi:MAG TPA: hypothetical protein VJ840_14740 [Gemmatimonadaceae bacterium]|nr:hypothetical protein [Gemmatimonadaceae bacterium]
MALTRKQLGAMKEDKLRTEILIPLFIAMKFRDVDHYHGGTAEQGKDIVMWKPDDFGTRISYAVVAKVGKISGKAQGKGSAATARFQIEQAFGGSYRDKLTGEEQSVNQCLVVATGVISKDARNSIKNALKGTNAERNVRFINGDELWELLERYLPESVVLDKLVAAREVFENVSPHHRITAKLNDSGVVLSTEPKYAGAERVDPIEFKVRLEYPNTPEGITARHAFAKHISTGAPVRVPRSFVADLQVPEFLRPYIKIDEMSHFEFGPRQAPNLVLADLILRPAEGSEIKIANLEFRGVQAGEDEITIDNSHQLTQYHFRIRLNQLDKTANVTFDLKLKPENVLRALERVRIWEALSSGCQFTLINAETGVKLLDSGQLPPNQAMAPPKGLVEFFERVLLIQTRTGTLITIPARDFTPEEVRVVYDLAARLEHGRITGTAKSVSAMLHRAGIEQAVAGRLDDGEQFLTISQVEVWTILDTEVPIGRAVSVFKGMTLPKRAIEEIKARLKDEPDLDSFPVQFEPREGLADVEMMYPDSIRGGDPEDHRHLEALSNLGTASEDVR